MKSEIEIFRTGTHTDMNGRTITVSRDDLLAMAGAYDPASHEAPIVLGHPKHNDPAMGWVKGLSVSDDGILNAELHQVNPDFSEVVDKGAFKKISASLYPPGARGNPAGDKYGLRHVGFLGGAVPAIKGLKSVQFAGDDGDDTAAMTFTADFGETGWSLKNIARAFRGLREYFIDKDGLESADKILPDYLVGSIEDGAKNVSDAENTAAENTVDAPNPVFAEKKPETGNNNGFAEKTSVSEDHNGLRQGQAPARSFSAGGGVREHGGVSPTNNQKDKQMDDDQKEKDFAEREAALKEKEEALAAQQTDFAEQQRKILEADNAAFVEAQIKAGKLASGLKDKTLAFMNNIDAAEIVSFGEGETKTALEFFKDMFTAAKPVVDFSEHTADDGKGGSNPETYQEFLEPALSFQAEQKQKGIEIDIGCAVDHVRKGTDK